MGCGNQRTPTGNRLTCSSGDVAETWHHWSITHYSHKEAERLLDKTQGNSDERDSSRRSGGGHYRETQWDSYNNVKHKHENIKTQWCAEVNHYSVFFSPNYLLSVPFARCDVFQMPLSIKMLLLITILKFICVGVCVCVWWVLTAMTVGPNTIIAFCISRGVTICKLRLFRNICCLRCRKPLSLGRSALSASPTSLLAN